MKNFKNIFVIVGLLVIGYIAFSHDDPEKQAIADCDSGKMAGCWGIGNLSKRSGDIAKAKEMYSKACNGGLERACKSLQELDANSK